jgi:hypothetical membrane protein
MRASLQIDKWLISAVAIAMASILQFVVIVPTAMQRYPGGTIRDQDTHGYSWTENWLSDLGRDRAWNGQDNHASARLFNRSIIALGIGMAVFFLVSDRAFEEVTALRLLGQTCGVLAGVGLIGIGFTPVDRFDAAHVNSLLLWIIPMGIYAVIFGIDCWNFRGFWSWILIFACTALVYGIVMYGMSTATSEVIRMQKLVALLSIAWFLIITARVGMAAFYIISHVKSRSQIADEQAVRYLRQFERGRNTPRPRGDD